MSEKIFETVDGANGICLGKSGHIWHSLNKLVIVGSISGFWRILCKLELTPNDGRISRARTGRKIEKLGGKK